MTLASHDPRLHIGYGGRRYPSRTIASCDTHIRDLTDRIRECRDLNLIAQYEQDRDCILEIRHRLQARHQ